MPARKDTQELRIGDGEKIRAGLGFQFSRCEDGRIIVSAIRDGGPALFDGQLQPQVELITVDGLELARASVHRIRASILGQQDSLVRLRVFRASENRFLHAFARVCSRMDMYMCTTYRWIDR